MATLLSGCRHQASDMIHVGAILAADSRLHFAVSNRTHRPIMVRLRDLPWCSECTSNKLGVTIVGEKEIDFVRPLLILDSPYGWTTIQPGSEIGGELDLSLFFPALSNRFASSVEVRWVTELPLSHNDPYVFSTFITNGVTRGSLDLRGME
jgi:hypothetical protein